MGGGGWVATKWEAQTKSTMKTAKWDPLVPFSPPHINTKQLNPWPNSSASHIMKLLLVVCLSRGDGAIWRPPEYLWMSEKPQKQATTKSAWAMFSTNTWLNCLLRCIAIVWWWKVCLDVVCVEAGVSLIQSHSCMCSCHQSYGFLLKLNILHVQILSFGSCSYMELIGKLTYIIHPSPFM